MNRSSKFRLAGYALALVVFIGVASIGAVPDASAQVLPPYPILNGYDIKGVGIEPRDNAEINEVTGNKPGFIVAHMPWDFWEGQLTLANGGSCPAGMILYDGHCFTIPADIDGIVREYSARGVYVSAVLYGVPAWARTQKPCNPAAVISPRFCSPDNAADFGRFAGMVAARYNGGANGRIVNFIIHNEVNAAVWYNNGCGQGIPCNLAAWTSDYANNFNAAYDRINPPNTPANGKVFVSFTGAFQGPENVANGEVNIKTFLTDLAPKLDAGVARSWSVSVHPYTLNWSSAVHSPEDYPMATPGSIGHLAHWLRATFPSKPSAWEITMSEGGLAGVIGNPASLTQQADYLCKAFRNVLGTPGINSYHYTSLTDHPAIPEMQGLLACPDSNGCVWANRQYKNAWATWALANRIEYNIVSCGFEDLPYARLSRYSHPNRGHWVSTRTPPAGFNLEGSWKILRNPEPGTRLLYEYLAASGAYYWAGPHNFVGSTANAGLFQLGPLGYVWTASAPGRVPLYRCYVWYPGYETHYVSSNATCEGWSSEELLGYALPG